MPDNFYRQYSKRIFDFTLAYTGIILLSPILIVVSILIKVVDGPPVFFRQSRVGYGFKNFKILKFRTMRKDAEKYGPSVTSEKDIRITRIGALLRKTKLDELPQLFNVLLGDMSIVGPRPEIQKYVEMFKKDYSFLLSVKPGITDIVALTFIDEERILSEYTDVEGAYIRHFLSKKISLYGKYTEVMSFHYDLYLIFMTMYQLFTRSLVSSFIMKKAN